MLCKLGHNIDFTQDYIARECSVCSEEDCEESHCFQGYEGDDDEEDEDEDEIDGRSGRYSDYSDY
jgi:hypothetical protein